MQPCTLCGLTTNSSVVVDVSTPFCCHGCHAVYQILFAQNALASYKEHPLYQNALKMGIISNPELISEIQKEKIECSKEESIKYYLEIERMWCPSCAEVIKWMLLREKGIVRCVVDYATDLACIEYFPRYINKELIEKTIIRLGYGARSLQEETEKKDQSALLLRFIIAAFCSLNIMMFSYPVYASYFSEDNEGYSRLLVWLGFISSIPLVTYCIWPIVNRCRNSLRVGIMGMETLVVIGVFSAFFLSAANVFFGNNHVYFDSMSAIITLVLLGKIIESKAKFSSKDSILRILRSSPKRGRKKLSDGSCVFVPIKDIKVGDSLIVTAGEKVVLDGVVIEGNGVCDESLMTGEPLPRVKKNGDQLIGSTFIQNGSLTYRVTALLQDTALHKIIDAVEDNITHKTKYIRAADVIVKYFVPIILLIAFFTGLWTYYFSETNFSITQAIVRAMSVLLISCPCAIGIAAPLAEAYLIHGLANLGVLVRNRGCLKILGLETHFFCDKTGTITEGKFHVLDGLDKIPIDEKAILKGICEHSNHPIATSTYNSIDSSLKVYRELNTQEISGKGMIGYHLNEPYFFGSKSFLSNQGCLIDEIQENLYEVKSSVFFGKKEEKAYRIVLGDRIKYDVDELIQSMPNVRKILISGDSLETVQAVAEKCRFDSFYSECSPLRKKEIIEKIKCEEGIVCMLGDGINDAPALTAANIGISVISASDISVHVSDIILTTESLSVIPKIRKLALKGQRIINQNLFWAFFYNGIGITLAVMGWLLPLFAAIAMVLSSLIVVVNARRLKTSSKHL